MMRLLVVLLFLSQSLEAQSINKRPASARATITNSTVYAGSFSATGVANVCGVIPKMMSLTGVDNFVIEYPYDEVPAATITSVSFGSKQLVGKTVTSSKFLLNVSVKMPDGSKPYAYVLHTEDGRPGNSGTATLTKGKGTAITLKVVGKNERGESINFSMTCN